ncbi:MAG: acyl-CoA dehydrogenase family protein, partial [Thermomicrobiales bacterium]
MNVSVAMPKAQFDGAELVTRARDMVPFLREMEKTANSMRRPPEETRLRLKEQGFSRIFQPRRYGGAEGRLIDGVNVLRELAHGCGSTAWIVVQNILHNLMLANWPEHAQDEVWG